MSDMEKSDIDTSDHKSQSKEPEVVSSGVQVSDSSHVSLAVDSSASSKTLQVTPKSSGLSAQDVQSSLTKILTVPSYPAFSELVETETVQRASKTQLYPGDLIELVKSRDLTKFYEAQKAVEMVQPTTGKSEYAHLPLEEIMQKFGLHDVKQGLSDCQVNLNMELYGKNVLDMGKKDPIWKIFLSQFKSFVILLLFLAAIASLALKNYVEGIFIFFIVTLNSTMATYMERSAANVLEKLAAISSPTALVLRNGVEKKILSSEVVPGDVVVLKTGDTVVADIRLVEITEIRINESLLTGESIDVKKTLVAEDLHTPFSSNLCFASTSVVSGFGIGIAVNTGMNTQVGKIAKQLKKASETSKVTPLQRGLNRLGGTIGVISTLVLVTIVIVAILTGFDDPTRPNTNRTLSIVLLAVGFAASSIPEGLPMVVTISLSLGAKDMAKENANILKLPSVETLGCCSVICSDKTGTLTEGKMVTTDLVIFYDGGEGPKPADKTSTETLKDKGMNILNKLSGRSSSIKSVTSKDEDQKWVKSRRLMFYPTFGFTPLGGVFYPEDLTDTFKEKLIGLYRKEHDFKELDSNLLSYKVEGLPISKSFDESVQSKGDKVEDFDVKDSKDSDEVKQVTHRKTKSGKTSDEDRYSNKLLKLNMSVAYLNSYNTKLVFEANKKWSCIGNMTESPLVVAASKCGFDKNLYEKYPRLDKLEVPFNSKRKLSITVHKLNEDNEFESLSFVQEGKKFTHVALVKGAPDVLRPYCKYLVSFVPKSSQSDPQSTHSLSVDIDKCSTLTFNPDKFTETLQNEGQSNTENPELNTSDQNVTSDGATSEFSGTDSSVDKGQTYLDLIQKFSTTGKDKSSTKDKVLEMNEMLSNNSLRVIMLGLVPLTDYDVKYLEAMEDSENRQYFILNSVDKLSRKLSKSSKGVDASTVSFETSAPESKENSSKLYKTPSNVNGRMVLLGISGSLDPPRPGVKESIQICRNAGVRVIMITGDQKATAVSIAKKIDLIGPKATFTPQIKSKSVSGVKDGTMPDQNTPSFTPAPSNFEDRARTLSQYSKSSSDVEFEGKIGIDKEKTLKGDESSKGTSLSPEALSGQSMGEPLKDSESTKSKELTLDELGLECNKLHLCANPSMDFLPDHIIDELVAHFNVFCRAQPDDKVAIVNSLKRKGEIVAMTGDGVNDAAALKTADIGISMGINGTDVAKGASEVVLLDDNFCTIVKAIRGGRTIFSNIQKFVSFLLGTNIGEILYLTTSIIISTLPPLEALQILFLNFLTDGCPAVALSIEPCDSDAMSVPPRKKNTPIMTRDWWLYGNLPHTIYEALSVIAAILISLYMFTGVVRLKDIHSQCRYISFVNKDNVKQDLVYFCKSYEYIFTREYVGWVTNIDYYDPFDKKMRTFLGAAKGRQEVLKTTDDNLHPFLKEKFKDFNESKLQKLNSEMSKYVKFDENGWIMSNGKQNSDDPNLYGAGPKGYRDIVGRKSIQARSLSFVTAVWSEMLRAYTVRSWEYFHKVFNRNPWMHIACSISATITFALTVIPGISRILHVSSLSYWQYLLAIALSLLTLLLDEYLTKVIYHRVKGTHKKNNHKSH